MAPSGVLCSVVRDLQMCMKPLMYIKSDDVLEALLFKAADNKPGAFLTLAEEATLLGKDPAPQKAQKITTCPLDHPEETPRPKVQLELHTLRMVRCR